MFVSTSQATAVVQVFASPPAIRRLPLPPPSCVPALLPFGRRVEEPESFSERQGFTPPGNLDPERLTCRAPLDLVAGPDSVLVGERLGKRYLELARDLRHLLTLARIESLFN